MNNLYIKLKKELKYMGMAFAIGLVVTFTVAMTTNNYANEISEDIADSVLRLHIRANSDEEFDQQLKLKVRDTLLKEFENELRTAKTKEDLIEVINLNMDKIIEVAERVIVENGYNYNVSARVGEAFLETRKYGDVYLPAGMYDCLIIEIGSGEGKNWWCVLFPPLCYVEETGLAPQKDKDVLKESLTKEEYDIIMNDKDIDIQVKFKILEFWGNKRNN